MAMAMASAIMWKVLRFLGFASQDLISGVQSSGDQTKVPLFIQEKENRNQGKTNLNIENPKNGKEESKAEKEALSKSPKETKTPRLDSLEEAGKDIKTKQKIEIKELTENYAKHKINQEKEMKEFNESHAMNILKVGRAFGQQRQELDVITEFKALKRDKLKECDDKEYCWSYIGQVGFNLLGNIYHHVLPEHYVEDWRYKLKDIEDAIEDEDLFKDTDERQKALKTWTGLKEDLGWEPSIERTLKMLQREENPSSIGCSRDLTVEEAERVAKELNKQGRLRGRLSYENIQKVIEMWKTSTKWEGMEGP